MKTGRRLLFLGKVSLYRLNYTTFHQKLQIGWASVSEEQEQRVLISFILASADKLEADLSHLVNITHNEQAYKRRNRSITLQ